METLTIKKIKKIITEIFSLMGYSSIPQIWDLDNIPICELLSRLGKDNSNYMHLITNIRDRQLPEFRKYGYDLTADIVSNHIHNRYGGKFDHLIARLYEVGIDDSK